MMFEMLRGLSAAATFLFLFEISKEYHLWGLKVDPSHPLQALASVRNLNAPVVDTKKPLIVQRDDFGGFGPQNDWPSVFQELQDKIDLEVGSAEAEIFRPNFTTTSRLQQTCYAAAMMDAYQASFG